ncbi:hypothetical protein BB561_005911 [Smittium simulii]|uniref:Large ribosomal subunit protein mL49 n=1 Tax=Smittium simulii TaxID=133385 RepID=A0A2T9Y7J6_9FUNG|nr:hypothetical protein BB561_005911 [Smittium simulii]
MISLFKKSLNLNATTHLVKHSIFARAFSSSTLAPSITPALSYYVERSTFRSLPVYTEFRNNNTRKLTLIRKITGNIDQLKADLEPIVGPDIKINKNTNTVIIKGIFLREVREFLTKKGF